MPPHGFPPSLRTSTTDPSVSSPAREPPDRPWFLLDVLPTLAATPCGCDSEHNGQVNCRRRGWDGRDGIYPRVRRRRLGLPSLLLPLGPKARKGVPLGVGLALTANTGGHLPLHSQKRAKGVKYPPVTVPVLPLLFSMRALCDGDEKPRKRAKGWPLQPHNCAPPYPPPLFSMRAFGWPILDAWRNERECPLRS